MGEFGCPSCVDCPNWRGGRFETGRVREGDRCFWAEKWGLGVCESVSKCEKLQKNRKNSTKVVELRSNKFAKCVKRWKIYEDVDVKMGGLVGQKLAGREATVRL